MSPILTEKATTIENLRFACECESNARARYTAFAARADLDGWHGIAILFRAAARAEEIHSRNHLHALKLLGEQKVHCAIHPIELSSTLKNLRVSLACENHEIDSMYPPFLSQACAGNVNTAIRCFTWALEAEKSHAQLLREALEVVEEDMNDGSAALPAKFRVCALCGYTSEIFDNDEDCPVCNLPREKFEVVR